MPIITTYKRFDGESDDELIYRITGQKEQIGSWQDVANILNELLGTDYGESTFRKKRQSFDKMFSANQAKFIESSEQLEEIKSERLLLEKEKVKFRDERNEYNRIIRQEARKESYKDQIIRSITEYQSKPLEYDHSKQFTGILRTDNDLIISLFDIHTGIKIDNYWNKFDTEILRVRLVQYLDKIFEVQVRHGSENAFVILSELLSGLIHPTLRIENNQDLINQFLTITDFISQFLSELSYHFNEVHVYIAPGNHSRITPKKDDSLSYENMDNLAIPFLSAKLQNFKNVHCHTNTIEQSIAMFSVRGKTVFSSHGDKETPQNAIQKLTLFTGIKPDLYYCGHMHTNALTTVYNSKVIQSSTLAGSDSYCMDNRLQNKPEQTISVITENGLDCLYNVVFD